MLEMMNYNDICIIEEKELVYSFLVERLYNLLLKQELVLDLLLSFEMR